MAFEKLKKNQTVVPRAAPLAPASVNLQRPQPGIGQQVGMMAADKVMDTAVNKGAEMLFKKAATGAATKAATGAAAGSAAAGLGTAAAMTNPVTAPLAIAAMVAPKLMGK